MVLLLALNVLAICVSAIKHWLMIMRLRVPFSHELTALLLQKVLGCQLLVEICFANIADNFEVGLNAELFYA